MSVYRLQNWLGFLFPNTKKSKKKKKNQPTCRQPSNDIYQNQAFWTQNQKCIQIMTQHHPQTTFKSEIKEKKQGRDVWGSFQGWGGGTCERACLSWPIVHECFCFLLVTPASGIRLPPDTLSLPTRNVFLALCCCSVVSGVGPAKHRITEAAAPCKGREMVQTL